ncbi:MAG TPA: glucosidase [Anaerolineae bacterium]|nr:glucosidase [Anaerolineae bacterium]
MATESFASAEHRRLIEGQPRTQPWKRWGPYLSERAWGTVREDYSPYGAAWDYFPHDHARSRAFRWNEDGLAGISDDRQYLCFAVALWNGKDPILKERLFGLTGPQGNHGEDVKEYYFYLDSTPTHSTMSMLYKYPQAEFPYRQLVEENARRGKHDPEFELFDTGVFGEDRYFDVLVEYAKAAPDDILIRITAANRGPEAAPLHILPTLWFRNTWSWGRDERRPTLSKSRILREDGSFVHAVGAQHHILGEYELYCKGADELIFTHNESNAQRLWGAPSATLYVKDAFHEYVVHGNRAAVNPDLTGTKAAAVYATTIGAGDSVTIKLRLTRIADAGSRISDSLQPTDNPQSAIRNPRSPFADFDAIFALRKQEADEFYAALQPPGLSDDERSVQRQAFAGMLWSKQFYHYDVNEWLEGDPAQPPPPVERKRGRNREWVHLNTSDVISMPDKWEYPWFAAWDLAFHCISLALVDADFAKRQLVLLTREWYQHPNGQIPAYEWAFGDVNPPVIAWAAWRVYKIDAKQRAGGGDSVGGDFVGGDSSRRPDPSRRQPDCAFLERVFHKLLLNFTWWVNRKDSEGNNIFQGGFLGLDNIGVFDRSAPLPTGGFIEQSDGTSWMGMFCLNMMRIALELARENPVYEDIATKFFEHCLYIAAAMNNIAGEGLSLWDEGDEFFYDVLHLPHGEHVPLKLRSMVGLIPLFAVEVIDSALLDSVPGFKRRLEWFLENRPELAKLVSRWYEPGMGETRLVAMTRGHRLKRLLRRALDPNEFLSDYGVRALSKVHEAHPYVMAVDGMQHVVRYEPAESRSGLFGGNSNWRGPIWFPVNYLLIESLQRFHHYFGDDFKVEYPTGSGRLLTLNQIADELSRRLIRIFTRDESGRRAVFGGNEVFQRDPHWRDVVPFHEYFHGDDGAGIGASHQTGWTGLVAKLIQQQGMRGNR